MKLTQTTVAAVKPPARGQVFYRDTDLRGFALRVTGGGTKAFIVEKRVTGQVRRITLGQWPVMKAEEGRRKAHALLGAIAAGYDPVAERQAAETANVTLDEVWFEYRERRALKASTIYRYEQALRSFFADWRARPLSEIDSGMVLERHTRITGENGRARANFAMVLLGALFNYAAGRYEPMFAVNPVKKLSRLKAWHRIERRQTVIKEHELERWYRAVQSIKASGSEFDAAVADYLVLILFTGLRRQEAAQLAWGDIDFPGRTLTITAERTKNGKSHTLPLGPFVMAVLQTRRAQQAREFVFPSRGAGGHIREPKYVMHRITEASRVVFTIHDLRRTFATAAERLDTAAFALKRLLNHSDGGDVTAGYLIFDVERLRKPMEAVERYLLSAMGVEPTADIVTLESSHAAR